MCKNRRVRITAGVVAVFVLLFIGHAQQKYLLPVLTYHSISASPPGKNLLAVSAKTFEQQMRLLRKFKYNVLTLEQAAAAIRDRAFIERAVAVTFDDGYEDNYTLAFPVLKKYRIPATIFVICSKIGAPGYLTWDQVREMQDSGLIVFGSHTLNHVALVLAGPAELEQEISGSKNLLAEKLSRPATLFCYPFGNFNEKVEAAVKAAGYTVAVAGNPGGKVRDNDILAIKRLRISENAGSAAVFLLETSGYYNFIREIQQRKKRAY
jgi:peptidoglycan/xylan/chitin deacetylase (PgdA/CDA1 family)